MSMQVERLNQKKLNFVKTMVYGDITSYCRQWHKKLQVQ